MDNFKQLIKEALTPKFLKEEIDAEYILNNLDKWLPNLSPGPFHFYDIIDDGDVDEMVDLIHTYGDEEVLKDYGLDHWDREDVTQLADYIISRGNKETDLAPQGKRTIGLKNEVVGLGDSQPKDDDEDPDDSPAHEAGSFATNEEIELSSLIDKDRMKDAAMEGTMRGLVGKVNKMMEISAKIERTLRREPELDFKVRDTEMLLRHLNHQLSVLKEKFKF